MTEQEWIDEMEVYHYGESARAKGLKQEQIRLYKEWLSRFNPGQRKVLFEKAVEVCKYFPKIAELQKLAEEAGFRGPLTERTSQPDHVWTPTDCRLCHGQGRLAIFKEVYKSKTAEGIQIHRRQTRILPLEGGDTMDYRYAHPAEEEYWCRCACPAGDTPVLVTLGWPRYGGAREGHHGNDR